MKKIISIAFICLFALFIGWNTYQNNNSMQLPDTAIGNIKALANIKPPVGDCATLCASPGYMCIIKYSNGASTSCPDSWK